MLDLERGGEPRVLIDSDALEDQAAFSPDGRSIAFVSTASGNAEVYTLPFTPERTVPIRAARNVTNHPGNDFRPAFAPDGRALAFSSDRDLPIRVQSPAAITRIRSGDVYTVDLASLQTRRLTDAPGWDGSPAWSPNGNTIAFYSERGRPLDALMRTRLWLMDADGENQRALEVGEIGGALSPQFLPNGRIVFARRLKPLTRDSQFDEAGTWHLASVNADGSDVRIESDDGAGNYWQPAPGPRGWLVAYGAAPDHRRTVQDPTSPAARRSCSRYPIAP